MVYYFENPFVLGSLLLFFLVFTVYLKFIVKKSYIYLLFFTIMYIYVCNVISITQFPIYALDNMRKVMGGQNVWREMNVIPFKEIVFHFSSEVLLNILLTIPLGFGLPFLTRCSWRKIFLIGALSGCVIEMGQLLSALWVGFTYRHVNIDDAILNLLGALLGYTLFKGFKKIFKIGITKLKLKKNTFLEYINEVCDEI